MSQLDHIEAMLTELVKASRKQRAVECCNHHLRRRESITMTGEEVIRLDKQNERDVKNIIKFGGDIN
jgi:hypothetical protein